MTYGDLVRNMTDEEIADFLTDVQTDICIRILHGSGFPVPDLEERRNNTRHDWIELLKKEVEP